MKFKKGDKVVVQIESVEYFGELPTHYRLNTGTKILISELDKAEPAKEAKPAAKKTTKK